MSGEQRSGIGVDAMGGPVIDPSENVKALNEAGLKRQDDIREMFDRYVEARIAVVRETVKWMEKLSDVHQYHDREIHKMEQEKLAAFRASDEAARITEAERTLAAVQLVARSAETTANDIRAVLNTTAQTLASANAARDLEFNNRISALEKSSYEGAGKQAVADPMQAEMLNEFKAMRLSFAEGQGKAVVIDPMIANMMAEQKRTNDILVEKLGSSKGMDKMWAWIVGGIGLLYILLKLAGKL